MTSTSQQPAGKTPAAATTPTLPPEAIEAITARPPDAPKRCFICLMDKEPSEPDSTWVDPCPCTLEAHQDCMQSWVIDCERSGKPFQCPVCKTAIELEGPWDPIVAIGDVIHRKFSRASPFMLLTAASVGVQISLQMYGAVALGTFAGKEALMRFLLGPDMVMDWKSRTTASFARERIGNSLVLMNVAPALLLSQLLPGLGNKIFVPTASLYGIYHVMHDDHFFSWPPSPQLAMAVFPYIRSTYFNLWREFVFPVEVKLNRELLGLPANEAPQNQGAANDRRNGERNDERNGEGGVIGLLQNLLDALDPEGEGEGLPVAGAELRIVQEEAPAEDGARNLDVMVEVVVEDVAEGQEPEQEQGQEHGIVEAEVVPAVLPPRAPGDQPPAAPRAGDLPNDQREEVNGEHEAPQPPAADRPGLGTILSNTSNALVSALILPGISFAVGEALKLVFPRSWTRGSGAGRPNLLQQQWGRSLVGGCLYVVMRDALRVYTKYRKVSTMNQRRVKNVDRDRRRNKR